MNFAYNDQVPIQMAESILPWPECLGTFDEDSCRYFLRELGQRVVQFYPFSVGMEEVFNQMVVRYGFDGVSDAMSVLQELLEDESAADGIGDDGDIWRSWRHSWRHRNHDSHNPYVPRVHGRILPPATSTRIRLLKATNFTVCQPARSRANSHHISRLTTVEEIETLNSILADPVRHDSNVSPPTKSPRSPSADLQVYDDGVPTAKRPTGDSNESIQIALQIDRRTASPRRSMPLPVRKHNYPFNLISPRRRNTATSPEFLNLDRKSSDSREAPASNSPQDCLGEASEKTPWSQCLNRQDNRYSLPSDFGSLDTDASPTKGRRLHRQARMIDGALFQGKTRKDRLIRDVGRTDCLSPEQATQICFHSHQRPRASWLHAILNRLQSKQKRKHAESQQSSLGDCDFIVKLPRDYNEYHREKEATPCLPRMGKESAAYTMGLDGTWDEEHNNKPLPLSPLEQSARPSLQSETERYIFQQSPEIATFDFRKPFASPGLANIRQKDELRSLVSATMSGPQELSPREKALKYRYSDNSSQSPPISPKSFTTFANKNPFRHSGDQPTERNDHPSSQAHSYDEVSSTIWPFRTDQNRSRSPNARQTPIREDVRASPRDARGALPDRAVTYEEDARGRRPVTPPTTPSRSRFGLKGRSPQKTPRPRSRSPVKRLVGMVKSMSTNQIPTSTPPRGDTPSSTKGKKWKELSNKIRNGFLTADLEQLEQEELMDQYASNSTRDAIRVVTPPSTHDRTIFPVSIRSSGQSKLWSELEYMLIETTNTFIKAEVEHDRIPRDSVIHTKRQWQARNRPQVVEFYYDQATQYDLIISNLRTVKLYSDYAQDAIMLNSVMHQWKILIRELSVKTLCMPDSIVRRWLHDGRRVLELLGAPTVTLTNMDKLTTLCMAVIGSAEKERARQQQESLRRAHRRSASDGSQVTLFKHEDALLRSSQTPPPLPTPTSLSSGTPQSSRKITPQELQDHLRRKAPGRSPPDSNQFVFTSGGVPDTHRNQSKRSPAHGYSKSHGLTPSEERARFMFD